MPNPLSRNAGRCFICFPPPLPDEYQGGPNNAAFMSGLAYGLVVLSYVKEGEGICEGHRPMLLAGLATIELALDQCDSLKEMAELTDLRVENRETFKNLKELLGEPTGHPPAKAPGRAN